jgi:hypothetical protein
MRSLRLLPFLLTVLTILATNATTVFAAATPVTTCGQVIAKRGVLTGDLDCSAFDGAAISLGKTGKLDLAGFTLTANDIIESYREPVVRGSSCTTTYHLTIPDTPYSGGDEWDVCP